MTEMDESLVDDLLALRDDSRVPPRPEAVAAARAALLASVAVQPRRRRFLALPALHPRSPQRLRLAMAAIGVGCAAVVALGWNAPAGTALHGIRTARERVQIAFPGSDGVSLRLSFAEGRMADARAGVQAAASLREAQDLLDAARPSLPSNASDPMVRRFDADEQELGGLEAAQPSTGSGATGSPDGAPASGGPTGSGHPAAGGQGGETPEGGAPPARATEPGDATHPGSARPSGSEQPDASRRPGTQPSHSPGETEDPRSSPRPSSSSGTSPSPTWGDNAAPAPGEAAAVPPAPSPGS